MRLYYASDIHGSEKLWRKFVNAASFYGADVLVMGGDLTGKVMVPIVEQEPGQWAARVFGKEQRATGEQALAELERRVRLTGYYPLRCDGSEFERLQLDARHRDAVFRSLMRDELAGWMSIAAQKLHGVGVRIFVMPGNDDDWDVDEILEGAPEPIVACEGRVVDAGGFQLLSSAWTNPTPWDSPRELGEGELLERFEKLAADLDADRPTVFNLHCPPHDSGLDLAPELTEDLRVVVEGGEPKLIPVGSTAVRAFIESHHPLLALHGHVHESRGAAKVDGTLCINPGSQYTEGVLDGVVVDMERDEVRSYQLVSG
jgi:Icc-related predicted phosphoesterase